MMAFVLAVLIAGALRQMGHQRAIRQWTPQFRRTSGPSPWAMAKTNSLQATISRLHFQPECPAENATPPPLLALLNLILRLFYNLQVYVVKNTQSALHRLTHAGTYICRNKHMYTLTRPGEKGVM